MIIIDKRRKSVNVNGTIVALSRLEWSALLALADNRGSVVSKDSLAIAIYGEDALAVGVTDAMIEKVVGRLRQKIRRAGAIQNIETRRGLGYTMWFDGEASEYVSPVVGDITELAMALPPSEQRMARAILRTMLEQTKTGGVV